MEAVTITVAIVGVVVVATIVHFVIFEFIAKYLSLPVETRRSSKQCLKIKLLQHRRHTESPLQRQIG